MDEGKKGTFCKLKEKNSFEIWACTFFLVKSLVELNEKKCQKNYGVKTRTKDFESKEGDKSSASKKAQKKSFPDFLSSITSISTRISNSKTFLSSFFSLE